MFCREWSISTNPTSICRRRRGWYSSNFTMIFCTRKLESLSIVLHYLCDPMFCRLDTIPECDGQTDRQTHMTTAYTALAQCRVVKTAYE